MVKQEYKGKNNGESRENSLTTSANSIKLNLIHQNLLRPWYGSEGVKDAWIGNPEESPSLNVMNLLYNPSSRFNANVRSDLYWTWILLLISCLLFSLFCQCSASFDLYLPFGLLISLMCLLVRSEQFKN